MASSPTRRRVKSAGRWTAWVLLCICLLTTLTAWQYARLAAQREARELFQSRADELLTAVQARMRAYEQVLRGAAGHFDAAGGRIDRADWRRYVQRLSLQRNYPGIQGIGFAPFVRGEAAAARLERGTGDGSYRLWPAGARAEYAPILLLEPQDWRNQRALGYDMFSEPTRRAAMAAARDRGAAAVSGRVTLVQETEQGRQAGFLMYLPVYRGGGDPGSVEARREAIAGFVYSPFRMNDLMAGILGSAATDLALEIYDGESVEESALMYRSAPAAASEGLTAVLPLTVNDRRWTLRVAALPSLTGPIESGGPEFILAAGLLISLLVFSTLRATAATQSRAETIAETMADAFRRSEAKYGSLVQSTPDAIIIADQGGRIVGWNQGATNMFGYGETDVLGQPLVFILPARLRRAYHRAFRLAMRDSRGRFLGRMLELTALRQSGEEFPVELSLARWGADEVYVSTIIRDITQRKQAELALRLSEERFRMALKAADIVVFNQDRDLRYTWIYNPAFDLREADVIGRSDDELFGSHPVVDIKRRVLTTGVPAHEEVELVHRSGSAYYDLIVEPVWRDGMIAGIAGAAVNITPRKRVEQALIDVEARFRTTFEHSAMGIVISGIDGRIVEANPALVRMLGYEAAALRGSDFRGYVDPEDVRVEDGQLLDVTRGGRPFAKLYKRLRRRNGSTLWASVTTSLVRDASGSPTMVIRMVEDVTELRAAEEALQKAYRELEQRVEARTAELRSKAQELSRSNNELEQFAYVASHDLQEPLRSVSGFAQLLERRYGAGLGEEGRQFLRFIVEGTDRMRQLIVDLLTYSRAGAREKPQHAVDVAEVLAKVRANLDATIHERGAQISADPLPVVWAEESDLLQLFQNLISNALKFNRRRPPKVHVNVEERGCEWLFQVRDNGIGIDPRDFERIFTIFQRAHRQDEYPGTGVGLAVCKKVVERHQGRIWLESEPDKGTTFFFTLKKPIPERAPLLLEQLRQA